MSFQHPELSRNAAGAERRIADSLHQHPNDRSSIYREVRDLKRCETSEIFKKDLARINDALHKSGLLPHLQITSDGTVKPQPGTERGHDHVGGDGQTAAQHGLGYHRGRRRRHQHQHYRPHHRLRGHQHGGGGQGEHPDGGKFADGAYDGIKAPDQKTLDESIGDVLAEAKKRGLSKDATRAAVASMLVESKGNPKAVGDHGHSFGLFQLNDKGELRDAMRAGQMKSASDAFNPAENAHVALARFQQLQGRYHDAGQLAAAAQRPKYRGQYAGKVDSLLPKADALIADYYRRHPGA